MKASVAIQVLPDVQNEDELIRIVDEVIANCQKVAIKAGCPSVSAYIKVVYNPEGEVLTIDKKVTKHHQ